MNERDASPNTIPWPPLILVGSIVSCVGLHQWYPAPLGDLVFVRPVGVLVMACGVLLDVLAMASMRRARTNILPHRPAGQLLTSGIFAWSRNPIYLGNVLLLIGIGLVANNAWFIPGAAIALVLTDRLAVRREEAHLAHKFGNAYRLYARTTGRWFGRRSPS